MSTNQQINMYTASSSSANWRFTLSDGEQRKANVKRLFVLLEVFNTKYNVNQRFKEMEEDIYNKASSKIEYYQIITAKLQSLKHAQLKQEQQFQQKQL
ncbi:160_t:CDS:2 [Rhizophagus irregularis]|nr:160_t:CDS:2 [Rhizophagus irregularis]